MAGHYFYDPRPYYGLNMNTNLMPLDEVPTPLHHLHTCMVVIFYGACEHVWFVLMLRM
jgi:hypothetical protein